jgi:hypothetical protein
MTAANPDFRDGHGTLMPHFTNSNDTNRLEIAVPLGWHKDSTAPDRCPELLSQSAGTCDCRNVTDDSRPAPTK